MIILAEMKKQKHTKRTLFRVFDWNPGVRHCVFNLVKEHSRCCLTSVSISAQSARSSYKHQRHNIFGWEHEKFTAVRLELCLISQSIQLAKVTLKTQYIQTKP